MHDAHTIPVRRPQRRGPLGAFILIAIGLFLLVNNLLGGLSEWIVFAIGLAFLAAQIAGRNVAIPTGILMGLGASIGLRRYYPDSFEGLFFLVPLGLGFLLIWALDSRQRWAFWPAGVLVGVGLLAVVAALPELRQTLPEVVQLWPLVLVALGGWLLWTQYRRRA